MKRAVTIIGGVLLLGSAAVYSQSPRRDDAVRLFNEGSFEQAVKALSEVTKSNSGDAEAQYMLGTASLRTGRTKDAVKSYERAAKLRPDDARLVSALGYAYLITWNRKAEETAKRARRLSGSNAQANFVLAVLSLRRHEYTDAVDLASTALKSFPDFAAALHVRSKALVGVFGSEPFPPVRPPETRIGFLKQAHADLEKCIRVEKDPAAANELSQYLTSLEYFARYFSQPGKLNPIGKPDQPDPAVQPLKIRSKPVPSYTNAARVAGVEGTSILVVEFGANGNVGHVIVAKPLEEGLDREALAAARRIKFEPQLRNGKPESVVRRIEYSFGFR